ncbi:alkaline phosphatase family protein [Roseivirga pacifica]|uniref:alkaline phosphatase family protein n=1 Tax=Roseivirga pacifica TaxID=1267423 RepID=UPI003BAEF6B4
MKYTFRRNFAAYFWAVLGTALLFSCGAEQKQLAKHVVIIGVDGMSPDGIRNAETPNMDQMVVMGSSSMVARGVLPTVSSPNWASLIMGASPAQHGVTSNDWRKDKNNIPTQVSGTTAFFPTIFKVAKDQQPDLKTAIIYDWGGFGNLFDHSNPTYQEHAEGEENTTERVVEYFTKEKPNFLFVHLDHVDHAGHSEGHGTPAYYESVEKADQLIGKIMAAVANSDVSDETVIIVTSDHGGVGMGHGGESLAEIEIPWIAYGKNIKQEKALRSAINTYDTPATAAYLLGLEIPQPWIGKPVLEAIEGEDVTLKYFTSERLQQPQITPKVDVYSDGGGLFVGESASLQIKNPNSTGIVRYTLDGTMPTSSSAEYQGALEITEHTIVKAAMFKDGARVSQVESGFFRFIPSEKGHGLKYAVYEVDEMKRLPIFSEFVPVAKGVALEPTLDRIALTRESQVAITFEGYIHIERAGYYSFFTKSDDGSKLFIDGQEVVNNDGDHGITEKSGSLSLSKGFHKIKVEYFNGGGGSWLGTYYQGPGIQKQPIPGSSLFISQ